MAYLKIGDLPLFSVSLASLFNFEFYVSRRDRLDLRCFNDVNY